MIIPFKNIDGRNIVEALVEVPEQVFNHFPVTYKAGERLSEGTIEIAHVRHNTFTRVMGDAALCFKDQIDKLPIPEAKGNGIYVDLGAIKELTDDEIIQKMRDTPIKFYTTTEETLSKLGFYRKGPAKWWNIIFGEDREENWMDFDPNTDNLSSLIPKLYRSGYVQGQRKVRFDIKKALDMSLI